MNKLSLPLLSQLTQKFLTKGKISALSFLLLIFAMTAVPQALSVPILTATKIDTLIVDNDGDNVADPGDTIRYTAVLTNSGSTYAINVDFADAIDANTTLVAGSVKTTPIARHDSYTAIGNIGITVPAGSGVLVNDNDPDGGSVSVIPAAGGSANGGAFSLSANGSFAYMPPPGFEGADSFTYAVQDSDNNIDQATVFIVVNDVIWFIDNSAGGGGDGRLSAPFNSLSVFNTTAADDPGDVIFLYETDSGSYASGISLLANQILVGQGATSSLTSVAGLTLPPHSNELPSTGGTRPVITNSGGNGITLGNNNLLRGLDVGNTGTNAGVSGVNVTDLEIVEMSVAGSGKVNGMDFSNLNGTVSFDTVTVDGSNTRNVKVVNNSGTANFSVTNSTFDNAGTEVGLDFLGQGTANITFSVTDSSFTHNNSVQLKALAEDNSVIDATIIGNDFDGDPAVTGNVGIDLVAVDMGTITFDVIGTLANPQTFQPFRSQVINVFASGGGTASGRVNGNTVLGSASGAGIRAVAQVTDFNGFNPSITIQINGNNIDQVEGAGLAGIHIEARDGTNGLTGTAMIDATVTNNSVRTTDNVFPPVGGADAAIQVHLNDLNPASTPQNRVCLNATGNATQANGGTFGETDFFFGNDAISGTNSGVAQMQGFATSVSNTWFNVNGNTTTTSPTPLALGLGPVGGGTCATVAAVLDSPIVVVKATDTNSDIWAFVDKIDAMRAALYQTKSNTVQNINDEDANTTAVIDILNDGKDNVAAKTAAAPAMSGETINLVLGALDPGQIVVITFDVTVDAAIPANETQVCNQGLFTAANFANLLTDDPNVGGAANPTCTPVEPPPTFSFEKKTNGQDADDANGAKPVLDPGDPLTWTYEATNTGSSSVQEADINLVDDILGNLVIGGVPESGVSGPAGDGGVIGELEPGETWVYSVTGTASVVTSGDPGAVLGSCLNSGPNSTFVYENEGTLTITNVPGTLTDLSHYCITPEGDVTLIKSVTNDNGGTAGVNDFGLTIDGAPVNSGDTLSFAPGTVVAIDEADLAGYSFVSITGAGCPAALGGTITVNAGDNVVCTITNDDIQPTLTVVKDVVNDDGGTAVSSNFTINVSGTNVSSASFPGDAGGTTVTLDAGAYTVSEAGPFGYAGSFSTDCLGTIGVGENLTCTVTNDDIAPQLTVIKDVVNDDGGTEVSSAFTINVNGTNVSNSSFPGDAGGTTVTLDAGAYTVSEAGPFGYVGSFSTDCLGSIDIGENITCTVTNDDIQPTLTVIKDVVNDNGGTAVPSDFTMNVAGTNVSSSNFPGNAVGVVVTLDAGSYTVSEAGPFGYAGSFSADCLGTIGVGENLTCTITNDDIASQLTVIKDVVNGTASASDFTMNISGTNVSPSSFPGDAGGTTVTLEAGSYAVSESGTLGYEGSFSADCSGSIGIGESKTCTVTNTAYPPENVQLTADPATIDENGIVNLNGTFDDANTLDTHTITIDWGDSSMDTVINLTNDERSFSASHQYLDDDPTATSSDQYTVLVTIEDAAGASDTANASITVNNVTPEVGPITAPLDPVNINDQPISVTAVFTDPGTLDTHTAVWAWGDGSTDTGVISSGAVSASHTYAEPGVYTVSLTVTDDDTGVGTAVYQYIVIYDPAGGFVTGGGWIDSPPGAFTPDPSLTGRANFGFVAKYKKGQSTPDGSTEFQFQVADLNFHSNSYDWLVIAGHKAMFKGTGTINGSGNYGFLISAIDASLTPSTDTDLFRIKIWDRDNGDAVVYDNQIACSDSGEDADPCSAIGSGSIVIHKGGKANGK